MRIFLSLVVVIFSSQAFSESIKYGFTPEQEQWMLEQNQQTYVSRVVEAPVFDPTNPLTFDLLSETTVRPYAEYESAGYLIFSSTFDFKSLKAKETMAKNLPKDTTLVVFTHSNQESHINNIKFHFGQFLEKERLKVIYLPGAQKGFWARDGVPVPVWRSGEYGQQIFTVVDAAYYHHFEADKEFSQHFNAEMTKHDYYYEGGNFIANAQNECLIVNKQATSIIPDSIFKDHYGCEKLIRLPHIKGIGHADESVKFVDDNTVLTDAKQYKPILEQAGYSVKMLPRPKNQYETYVNSLLINGVIYVPIFGQKTDKKALEVYESFGFDKVIGINSSTLSNTGAGSLHCITMTYPKVGFDEVISQLGASEL